MQESDEMKFKTLIDWMIKGGAHISNKIHLKSQRNNYRAVYAKEPIKQDDILMFVPEKLIVRFDRTLKTERG